MPTPARSCRFCNRPLSRTFVDLGMSPLCQTHVGAEQLQDMEPFYPLHAYLCDACLLVQLPEIVNPERIFSEYAYFSSYADSWVEHARRYSEQMCERLHLGPGSQVIEIASNDGYLLQHFVARGIPSLGVEPAANVAEVAIRRGIPTEVSFFGRDSARKLAQRHPRPDLMIGNNVLAHVPDLNDFVAGMQLLLKQDGIITLEFPHLYRLMQFNQFDTIYHEHFSYFSFITVERIFAAHDLEIFEVEELPTHGGSLRIYAHHAGERSHALSPRVAALRAQERADGLDRIETYLAFGEQVRRTKHALLEFLIDARRSHKRIVGYGAPGKGNTLLNYCGIRTDFLDFTVDRNPYKQGKYTPGTRIPIRAPEELLAARPDYVLILPWNLREEIMQQMSAIRAWGGQFVVPIPTVQVL
ncbi:MAG TPA: class I SAM-dependent methyltransferase [Steroidobacteraceae bacterium]|jgi:SAM-dependent methyltransferase|nr:class I SAM-dependent methyltransferase [Steroidobacteraceae bacterium]